MFGSSTLSLPAPFAREHQPLRLSSESCRPQPTGQCHYQLVHPAARNQICACQMYHHNRSAPGNVCDCGHSACYHGATVSERVPAREGNPKIEITDKVKRLEDMIMSERQLREKAIAQERQTWESEVRILREALSTFYKNEEEMQSKLKMLEHELVGAITERQQLRDRLVTMDDAGMTLESRFDPVRSETNRSSSPGQSVQSSHNTSMTNHDDVPGLTSGDERSSSSSFSRHQTPNEIPTSFTEPESPRSSGILNLVNFPRPPVPPYTIPRRTSLVVVEEPRSSGFLGVDMREHMKTRMIRKQQPKQSSISPAISAQQYQTYRSPAPSSISPLPSIRLNTPQSRSRPSPPVGAGYPNHDQMYRETTSPKKRKHQSVNIMALDVLADVSAASPLIS